MNSDFKKLALFKTGYPKRYVSKIKMNAKEELLNGIKELEQF